MAGINIKLDVDCQRDNYPAENIAISLVIICIYKSYIGGKYTFTYMANKQHTQCDEEGCISQTLPRY